MFGTPKDIMEYDVDKVLELIEDNDKNLACDKVARYQLVKIIYAILGYDLSPDALLVLLTESQALAVLATAGAGKTTIVQVKIILEKLIRYIEDTGKKIEGRKVLCVVYNKHNVGQIEQKQRQLVARLKSSKVEGFDIDNEVNACTMHSFCSTWLDQYSTEAGLNGHRLMSENEKVMAFKNYMNILGRKHNMGIESVSTSDIIQLYDVIRESLVTYDDMDKLVQYQGIGLPKDFLKMTFEMIDKKKFNDSTYDFTDMLVRMHKLLLENDKVRERIQYYYHYVTADEFQDFTPVMFEILRLIKGEEVPLICIGDEDQSIYAFKGADIYNSLNFEEKFEDSKILSLILNRRCRAEILKFAKCVVEKNTLRFNKQILGTKDGGKVDLIPYNTAEGQIINVIKRLKAMRYEEREQTIVCYRNKKSSLLLTEMLEEEGIEFNTISGFMPFAHELYTHVFDVLGLLARPYDFDLFINLYKALPIAKSDLFKVLGYNPRNRKWTKEPVGKRFFDLDFKEFNKKPNFVKALSELARISDLVLDKPLDTYFKQVYLIILKYFWNWKKEQNKDEEIDSYYTQKVYDFFMIPRRFELLEAEYFKRKRICKMNNDNEMGVTLSTFHSLKGLENNRVIIIDFDDTIFPDFSGKDEVMGISDEAKLDLKECETRLCYVAITRAIDELSIYYNEQNPSVYIDWFKEIRANGKTKSVNVMDVFGATVATTRSTSSGLFTKTEPIIEEVKTDIVEVDLNSFGSVQEFNLDDAPVSDLGEGLGLDSLQSSVPVDLENLDKSGEIDLLDLNTNETDLVSLEEPKKEMLQGDKENDLEINMPEDNPETNEEIEERLLDIKRHKINENETPIYKNTDKVKLNEEIEIPKDAEDKTEKKSDITDEFMKMALDFL